MVVPPGGSNEKMVWEKTIAAPENIHIQMKCCYCLWTIDARYCQTDPGWEKKEKKIVMMKYNEDQLDHITLAFKTIQSEHLLFWCL